MEDFSYVTTEGENSAQPIYTDYDDLVCHSVTILSILTLSSLVTEWSLIHSEEVPWTLH